MDLTYGRLGFALFVEIVSIFQHIFDRERLRFLLAKLDRSLQMNFFVEIVHEIQAFRRRNSRHRRRRRNVFGYTRDQRLIFILAEIDNADDSIIFG